MHLELCTIHDCNKVSAMILELLNHHRRLNNAPVEYWTTLSESEEMFKMWIKVGMVYKLVESSTTVGFLYVRLTGKFVAILEDLYIENAFRNLGYGKKAMTQLDELMQNKGITSLLVEVVPRNSKAMDLYIEMGFDHLNLIQLRKNYDQRLNKEERVIVLDRELKVY